MTMRHQSVRQRHVTPTYGGGQRCRVRQAAYTCGTGTGQPRYSSIKFGHSHNKEEQVNKKQVKLLGASIKHWGKVVAGDEPGDDRHCPLCGEYVFQNLYCAGCPVFRKTGRHNCYGTPWYDFAEEARGDKYFALTSRAKIEAGRELAFLRSLLPKKPKTKPGRTKERR